MLSPNIKLSYIYFANCLFNLSFTMAKKKNKRKKSSTPVVRLSPAKYIKTKARHLPIHECHITEGWEDSGLATVIVTRRQPSGNLIIATYLVDTFCLGVKNTFYQYNATSWDYQELLERARFAQTMVPCDYALAHNVVYGALTFAEELGFTPHKDFDSVSQYILEEDTDDVEFMDLEFGREGEPVLFVNPGVNPTRYIKQLKQSVGEGNYQVMYGDEEWDDDDWDDDEENADGLPPYDLERPFRLMIEERARRVRADRLQTTDPSELQLSSMEIVYDPMTSPYTEGYADDRTAVEDALNDMYELALEKPEKAIPELRQLVEKYPRHPTFLNYLIVALKNTDQSDEVDRLTRQMYQNFPEYLYARINYADLLMDDEKPEEAFDLFDRQYSLDRVYPDRQTFHYTEVLTYYGFLARYSLSVGEPDKAASYVQAMYLIDEDHMQTTVTERMVGAELLSRAIGKLAREPMPTDDSPEQGDNS